MSTASLLTAELLPTPFETKLAYYSKEPVKVAVVGFGKMGILHASIINLLQEGAVKHIIDTSRFIRLGGSILLKGKVKFWRNLKDLLKQEEVDAVFVTTPTPSHFLIAKEVLETGIKGIFIEKPPTMNTYQTVELVDLAKHSIDMVGLTRRYSLTFRHAKELLASSVFKENIIEVKAYIRYGSAASHTRISSKISRGVLLDLGIYLLDLLHWYFGDLHVNKASCKHMYSSKIDDIFYAELTADDGFPIIIEADWTDPNFRFPEAKIEILGSNFTLEVSDDSLNLKYEGKNLEVYKPHYYANFPPVNLAYPEYVIEDMYFLTCLKSNCKPETSLTAAIKVMKMIDELYELAYL
jgi:predicted dehydrogenase